MAFQKWSSSFYISPASGLFSLQVKRPERDFEWQISDQFCRKLLRNRSSLQTDIKDVSNVLDFGSVELRTREKERKKYMWVIRTFGSTCSAWKSKRKKNNNKYKKKNITRSYVHEYMFIREHTGSTPCKRHENVQSCEIRIPCEMQSLCLEYYYCILVFYYVFSAMSLQYTWKSAYRQCILKTYRSALESIYYLGSTYTCYTALPG